MHKGLKQNYFGITLVHLFMILFSAACLIPMLTVISISISSERDILNYGYGILPRNIDFTAYKYIFFNSAQIINSYGVTIFVTVVGTILSLVVNSLAGYALSRRQFEYRNPLSFVIFFTTMFSGGLIPWYILISRYLKLSNSIWVMIIPLLASPWNMFILRTNFRTIPESIIESAKLDGAKELYIFFRLIVPLSTPAIATVGLLTALGYWNDWWLCLLFIDKPNLFNLQFVLYRVMANISYLTSAFSRAQSLGVSIDLSKLPDETARMAMVVLAAGPMLFCFLFFQKYFAKGLTVGSIKG